MKLWEALKELEENPKKVFKSNNGFGEVTLGYSNGIEFIGVQKTKNGTFLSELREWQEVKQPVTWQEAIEAWVNGKTIKCTMQGSDFVFDGYKPKLRDQIDTIGRIQLREGTWYIED